jgi:hypothetical protein
VAKLSRGAIAGVATAEVKVVASVVVGGTATVAGGMGVRAERFGRRKHVPAIPMSHERRRAMR